MWTPVEWAELFRRGGTDASVAWLRRVHEARGNGARPLVEPLPAAAPAVAPPSIVEVLWRELGSAGVDEWRARVGVEPESPQPESPQRDRPAGGGAERSLYERARDHFAARERDLRDHAAVTSRLIESLRADRRAATERAGAIEQQVLRVRVAEDGVAGGAFVVENAHAAPVVVRFTASSLASDDRSWSSAAPIEVRPTEARLEPGDAMRVDVRIALGPPEARPSETVTATVDVWFGERVVSSVWLEVAPRRTEGPGAGA